MKKYPRNLHFVFFVILVIFSEVFSPISLIRADTVSDLQAKIAERNNQIDALEKEIKEFNESVKVVSNQAQSLKSTITDLNNSEKKLGIEIKLTEQRIAKTELVITELASSIDDTKGQIDIATLAFKDTILKSYQMGEGSLLADFLNYKSLGDLWNGLDLNQSFENSLVSQSKKLTDIKNILDTRKASYVKNKNDLLSLQSDLNDQKNIIAENTKQKNLLLKQTKNQETEYKRLITERNAQKNKFENDLYNYEAELKIQIDKSKLPASGRAVLSWPLDKVIISQLFGKTAGAERLYASGSHNGVDFGASIGTPVKSVLNGVVVGTGNTDEFPGCYSFGKWVMVKHPNGLSTIYGHLSLIKVSKDQNVNTGDLLGYSGNTGYSTGPHLHLGVYATEGVRIEQFVKSHGCKQAVIPLADVKAYLDPMLYLPPYKK